MTGPEHYAEAQVFAEASVYAYQNFGDTGDPRQLESARWQQAQAQVHATLAHAAATALQFAVGDGMPAVSRAAWLTAAGTEVTR